MHKSAWLENSAIVAFLIHPKDQIKKMADVLNMFMAEQLKKKKIGFMTQTRSSSTAIHFAMYIRELKFCGLMN